MSVVFSCLLCSCRSRTPWNPYLSAKEKPSDKQRKEEQKQLKAGTKAYAEQMEKNKREIRKVQTPQTSARYKKITKLKRRKKKRYDFKL
ncbi:MAG: hypothetical protein ACJ77K_04175 [Bacteroidia bacterium]